MIINGDNIDINDLISEKHMHKKYDNGLFLSDYQAEVLNSYKIDYLSCKNTPELIFLIDQILDDDIDEDYEDLELVAKQISEYNYYNNTNK